MRLSFEDARRLNISEDIIRRAQEHAVSAESYDEIRSHYGGLLPTPKEEPPKRAKSTDGYDSKLERDFAECLKRAQKGGWIKRWWPHPFSLKLAPKCYYHPDFLVEPVYPADLSILSTSTEHRLILIECKGGWFRDDAKVKTKVAADMYPCFRWLLVTRDGQHDWVARDVTRNGIGLESIVVPWIGG